MVAKIKLFQFALFKTLLKKILFTREVSFYPTKFLSLLDFFLSILQKSDMLIIYILNKRLKEKNSHHVMIERRVGASCRKFLFENLKIFDLSELSTPGMHKGEPLCAFWYFCAYKSTYTTI